MPYYLSALMATLFATIVSASSEPLLQDDLKLNSFICLEEEQDLCLGISLFDDAHNGDNTMKLQVKRRFANLNKGDDFLKLRFTVDRVNGMIYKTNFTNMCVQRDRGQFGEVLDVGLESCPPLDAANKPRAKFDLGGFLENVNEQGKLYLKSDPTKCLTVMNCRRPKPDADFCAFDHNVPYTGKFFDVDNMKGSYVKFAECRDDQPSQVWRQALDCAPGCTPYMLGGECDEECRNDACGWDAGSCATPQPTPPTLSPTHSPSTTPTTSVPSVRPSKAPTVTAPSEGPNYVSPTESPVVAAPSEQPTVSTPTNSPTKSNPTKSPSKPPVVINTERGTTSSPTLSAGSGDLLWLWILLVILAVLIFSCCIFGVFYRRREQKKKEEEEERRQNENNNKSGKQLDGEPAAGAHSPLNSSDIEHNAGTAVRPAPRVPPPVPSRGTPATSEESIGEEEQAYVDSVQPVIATTTISDQQQQDEREPHQEALAIV